MPWIPCKDILAVGYGDWALGSPKPALICCWSLKNLTVRLYVTAFLLLLSSFNRKKIKFFRFVFYAQWPEQVYSCHSSVTCLDFSASNPSQLAVGMYDGSVAIYNVQVADHMACIANSRWEQSRLLKPHFWEHFMKTCLFLCSFCRDCSKRHQQPVWQVIWTKQQQQLSGEDREEVLVSVSGDGRITKWLILSNGFNCIGKYFRTDYSF